jgi:uncharacterized protein YjbJ (UPF0337 family)
MNWTQVEGKWKRLSGQAKSEWAKLTDDDLKLIGGKKDQLVGKLQEHYGALKQDAERQIDAWLAKLSAGRRDKATKKSSAHIMLRGGSAAVTENS